MRSGFFQITHVDTWMKTTLGSIFSKKSRESGKGSISQTQALSAALAACMGTGNIVGVAAAIASGGAGAVFWMVISAIIGMMSACCENILGIKYRYRDENGEWMGGAFVYMERGLGFRHMVKIFCVLLVIASLGIGNMTQANAAALSLSGSFGLSPAITGLILAAGVFAITCGGLKRIASAAEKIIPAMTAIFILASFAVIIKNFRAVPSAFSHIISEAFSLRAAAGGAAGYGIKKALRYGVARGVFSNEAGLGSNAIIHAAAQTDSPAEQGCWGILEVFLDTVVMCTVTAITLLVSGAPTDGDGSLACAAAFGSVFGKAGSIFVCVSICIFAFATLIGWSYYGRRGLEYLLGAKSAKIYNIIYAAAVFVEGLSRLPAAHESVPGIEVVGVRGAVVGEDGEMRECEPLVGTEKEIITILRAPHKYKDSREQFEMRTHKRLIDILQPSAKTVDALMKLDLPAGVDIEIKL